MELLKQDGTLKARGKLLFDLQEELKAQWESERDMTEAIEVVIGQDEDGVDIIETKPKWIYDVVATEADLDEYLKTRYAECRKAEYPPMAEYLDAIVKGDTVAQEAYTDKCLAVKAKYPK
jgi:hypothetical protein